MRKQIYVAPRLEVLLYNVENDLVANTIPIVIGDGEDLGKENIMVFSDYSDEEFTWGNLWADVEDDEE